MAMAHVFTAGSPEVADAASLIPRRMFNIPSKFLKAPNPRRDIFEEVSDANPPPRKSLIAHLSARMYLLMQIKRQFAVQGRSSKLTATLNRLRIIKAALSL